MMQQVWIATVVMGLVVLAPCAVAQSQSQVPNKVKVAPVAAIKAQEFPLTDVRLLDGPFKRAMELDKAYLLSLDPDRLLHTFRLNAGLPSNAQPLGGWEEPNCELRGHFVGHYLSGCALMFASTGDVRLKEKAMAVVRGLAECQAKMGSGYLSAFPEEFIDRVEARKRVWAPYYTLHKIYAGLMDMYVWCDDQLALEVCRKFGDWAIARNSRLTDEQMQRMLGEEHGGMNETLANLYALTGEDKYLKIAQRFNHMAVIGPASKREDRLTGLHANTQVPKFIGTARQYELTGQEWLKTASEFFWNTVVHERSYVIGGHSDGEMFSPKERLSEALGTNTTETCNTYNMLKLTRHLWCWEPNVPQADYYERALINHILASQHPGTGMMCYYVPLRPGLKRGGAGHGYNTPLHSFWCCTGTGVENHAKYGDSIYFHGGDVLFVNLFIASELDWKAQGVKVRQETAYPDEQRTRFVIGAARPARFALNVRWPGWCVDPSVKVNGEAVGLTGKAGESYISLRREWKDGDVVEVSLPFSLRTEGFKDNPNRLAFLHGPLVLCAEVKEGGPFPAVVTEDADLLKDLKPVEGKASTFEGRSNFQTVDDAPTAVMLEPFHKMHDRPYQTYFDRFTPAQWTAKREQYRAELARRKELDARTVDAVYPGQEQNERSHRVRGERTGTGPFGGKHFRHATDGGWFAWTMKVMEDRPQALRVTYWGSDAGGRTFDILIDDVKLATQTLDRKAPDRFYDEVYEIPAEMLKGKTSVTVKFQAHPGNFAGGVFEVRVMNR